MYRNMRLDATADLVGMHNSGHIVVARVNGRRGSLEMWMLIAKERRIT